MKFSLIIPAYNEELRIENVVNTYGPYFYNKFKDDFELIIIPNNCKDNTEKVVKDLAKKHPYLKYKTFNYYTGKGGAIVEGFKIAKGDLIGFVDSDLAVLPKQYEKLLDNIQHYDVAIASRWLKESNVKKREALKTIIAGRIYNIIFVRGFFGLNIKDTQCGGKVFKKELVQKIVPKIRVKGFGIDLDLLYKSKLSNAKIIEVPIEWSHVELGSKTKVAKNSLAMFKEMFITRFKK